jgi:transposase
MTTPENYAAFVGIDWADEEHDVCLLADQQYEQCSVPQQAEDLESWACKLRTRFEGRPVAVCLEQSRGPLIYALLKYSFLVLFPINPKQLARYREAFIPSGAKDDPTDARLLCQFLAQNYRQLRQLRPDDELTRSIRLLTEDRRRWVDERTALGNQLIQRLKEYFPLMLELTSKMYAAWFLHLLAKFPSHQELRRASPRTLERLLPKLRSVTDDEPQDLRVKTIRSAQPLVTDKAVVVANRLAVLHLVEQISQLNKTIATYDAEIAKQMANHPEAELFQSFPGAGDALAPRLVAALGTDRERYATVEDLQQISGIAPIKIQSGKSCIVRRRRACPKFLHQTFHEYADHSRKKSKWAGAYYLLLVHRGNGHNAALRSLAFKWQRIIFRCWKNKTPYDEERHLRQLQLKEAPLLRFLENSSK